MGVSFRYHSGTIMKVTNKGNPMSTLVIKNFPNSLHAELKRRAQTNHRSLAKEALTVIEQGISDAPGQTKRLVLPKPLRLKGGYKPTTEDIEAAIAEGRE